jgi:hypothetical protein
MRKENMELRGHQKLFRYYFLNLWREKPHKHVLQDKPELRNELIQSTQALFDEVKADGIVIEEFGAKTYHLGFHSSKELSGGQEGMTPGMTPGFTPGFTPGMTPSGEGNGTGSKSEAADAAIESLASWYADIQDSRMQVESGSQACELEVFLCGGNFEYKKASVDLAKMQETGEGSIMVRVNAQVDPQTSYTVFVPKKLI